VARGDADAIIIGESSNIQDLSMLHADPGKPLKIGNRVTIGHRVIVHGCTIEDDCLIGMGSVILNGAVIGHGSVVAAGAVILEDVEFPPFSLVAGVPGSLKRTLDRSVLEKIRQPAEIYVQRAGIYRSERGLFVV
jgi:carbonic anhydrase/acetyltransferase-like protein (isoleucine patch superfamily)